MNDLPIGVFDSGIGGLTVMSSIARMLPGERIFYFGDTARCPYGDRSDSEVRQFAIETFDYLIKLGVKVLVIGCNTATAIALPELVQRYDVPVIGVIRPGALSALASSPQGRIGVIGTAVTIGSDAYAAEIHQVAPTAEVFSLACPAFVPLVESGRLTGSEVDKVVADSLRPLMDRDLDVLILGCTHYPLLQTSIQRAMGPKVKLISSAEETARQVKRLLVSSELQSDAEFAEYQFFTTGDEERMMRAAIGFFGNPEPAVRHVELEKLQLQV